METENNKPYFRRWWIVGSILVGTWVGTLGGSMVPVALPSILKHYNIPLNTGIWLISIYTLMVAVLMPVFGWMGDRYGYRRIYFMGLAGFTIFSYMASIAPNFKWLMIFRILQGICNATTLPSVMGIISMIFPTNERGKAMGVWATVNGAAHGLGPVISGSLISLFDWPAIFLFTGTCTLIGLFFFYYFVPNDYKKDPRPFDWIGAGTFTLAILIFMLSLTQFRKVGWVLWQNLSLLCVSLVFFSIFLITETRISKPFINLRLFLNKAYSGVVAIAGVQFFCLMSLQILIPLYLMNLRGYSEIVAGLTIAVMSSTLAVFSPFSGWIADRKGSETTIRLGVMMITVATFTMIFWNNYLTTTSLLITLIFVGFGMGLIQSPAAATVTVVVPKDQLGIALGIFNMLRMISSTLGATTCGLVLGLSYFNSGSEFSAFRLNFIILSCLAALTFFKIIIVRPFQFNKPSS